MSTFGVLLVAQVAGAFGAGLIALAGAEQLPPAPSVAWAVAAGACGAVGLSALYQALGEGRMGVVAPVSGVLAAAIPVVVAIASGGLPGPLRLAGFGVGLGAVVLVSAGGEASIGRRGAGLALLAGVALGGYNTAIAQVSAGSMFASLAVSRAAEALFVAGAVVVTSTAWRPSRGLLPGLALVGCLDMAGNAFYVIAAQVGRLDVAAVLSSMYPVSTVILATIVLRERMTRLHLVGIAGAVVAIALIAGA